MFSADSCRTSTLSPHNREGTLPTYWPSSIEKNRRRPVPKLFRPRFVGSLNLLLAGSGDARLLGVSTERLLSCKSNALTNDRPGWPAVVTGVSVVVKTRPES